MPVEREIRTAQGFLGFVTFAGSLEKGDPARCLRPLKKSTLFDCPLDWRQVKAVMKRIAWIVGRIFEGLLFPDLEKGDPANVYETEKPCTVRSTAQLASGKSNYNEVWVNCWAYFWGSLFSRSPVSVFETPHQPSSFCVWVSRVRVVSQFWPVFRALEKAKQLFPGRVSIDLLFGRPNQSAQDWEQELEKVRPQHSTYPQRFWSVWMVFFICVTGSAIVWWPCFPVWADNWEGNTTVQGCEEWEEGMSELPRLQ